MVVTATQCGVLDFDLESVLGGNLVGPQKRLSGMSKFSLAGERKKRLSE